MNDLLLLKGQFNRRKNNYSFGPLNLPAGREVTVYHVSELINQLKNIIEFWENSNLINGALISVHYRSVIAKSNRIKRLFCGNSKSPNETICGAKYSNGNNSDNFHHIITHYLSLDVLKKTCNELEKCLLIISEQFNGVVTQKETNSINNGEYDDSVLKKTVFLQLILDINYVERLSIEEVDSKSKINPIVTLYKTDIDTKELLEKIGIVVASDRMMDENTVLLERKQIDLLVEKAPFLVSMHTVNFSKLVEEYSISEYIVDRITIKEPANEPIVGVIDTCFDETVYFSKWVDYRHMLDNAFDITPKDKIHGTEVSSIIVDGPSFNPKLQDNCGNFRVRHFGVCKAEGFNSFTIIKQIRNIVKDNAEIKVWNLSLGSVLGIDNNFISPEAAELDKIQNDFDVIFVIAGTNKNSNDSDIYIGAPADSLNSIVVNSVDYLGNPASYSRRGPVLSFFYKPDVSYYGGDVNKSMVVCSPLGKRNVLGTSYAAPWITRKIAYLIYNMGFSREIAKALLIDSAAGWNRKDGVSYLMGYGIVPIDIGDVINSQEDEIRFIMTGTIDEYETYTFNIPVPQEKNTHPFWAKATLVYFPQSDRSQGVDYTSTELDIHLGRVIEKNGKVTIKSIDNNKQAEDGLNVIYEENARRLYRKWDNVKHISETISSSSKPRKTYGAGMWGLSIKSKERFDPNAGKGMKFGVVITLREMKGVNRINEFIKLCNFKGWIVRNISIENQNVIYNKADEEIELQ